MVSLRAVVALVLLTGTLNADVTVAAAPVGVMTKKLGSGSTGLAFPLIKKDVLVGSVASNTSDTLAFTGAAGDIAAGLEPDHPYYAEIETGPFEGERLDVDTASTVAAANRSLVLKFGAGTNSTLVALAPGGLIGARVVVRPHVQLKDLVLMVSPKLAGNDKANLADGVNVFEGTAYAFYYLRGNGTDWGRKDAAGEFGNLVVPPDTSVQIVLRSAARSWISTGIVRTNAFRKNLAAGVQSFSTGFPVVLTPVELGAFAFPGSPSGTEWVGSADPDLADSLQAGVGKPVAFQKYFLDADGQTWRRVAGKTDVTDSPIAGATDAMLLRRSNPDSGYIILLPFTP